MQSVGLSLIEERNLNLVQVHRLFGVLNLLLDHAFKAPIPSPNIYEVIPRPRPSRFPGESEIKLFVKKGRATGHAIPHYNPLPAALRGWLGVPALGLMTPLQILRHMSRGRAPIGYVTKPLYADHRQCFFSDFTDHDDGHLRDYPMYDPIFGSNWDKIEKGLSRGRSKKEAEIDIAILLILFHEDFYVMRRGSFYYSDPSENTIEDHVAWVISIADGWWFEHRLRRLNDRDDLYVDGGVSADELLDGFKRVLDLLALMD